MIFLALACRILKYSSALFGGFCAFQPPKWYL
uniref:Uncharacterized protein n=1 Tax=Arundo donax TaxID=35708 RepID=A0A0A9EPW1_ARUDO